MKTSHVRVRLAGAVVLLGTLAFPWSASAATGQSGDLWISTAFDAVIERDGRLDPGQIITTCHDGVVVLQGFVPTQDDKGLAEQLAMLIPGVRGIDNDLLVVPPDDGNGRLVREIRSALIEDPSISISNLYVRADKGVVTLTGAVRERRTRRLAERLVMMSPHVRRVVDRLTILPTA